MPTRMVRDGIVDSEAVLALPPEGRWLYVTILLAADDYGLFEATSFKLAKWADVKREHVPQLLQVMADSDLVRLYTPDPSVPRVFGIVTKFRQRLRARFARYPLPSPSLVIDEPLILNKINELASKMPDGRPSSARQMTDTCRPEVEVEVEVEVEEPKGSMSSIPTGTSSLVVEADASTTRAPACPSERLIALWHEHCAPPLPTVGVLSVSRRKAMSARWREVCAGSDFDQRAGLDWFRWLFAERVATSDFLMGRVTRRGGDDPFRASLDWLLRPTNFAKVVDGNYVNRKGKA
jgi:hypothetical protein